MTLLHLLSAYGLCFGITHKAEAITTLAVRIPVVGSLFQTALECTFCMGFHCGWVVYLMGVLSSGTLFGFTEMLIFALSSAAFCYAFDAGVRWLETQVGS